jgi:hypothetical protein
MDRLDGGDTTSVTQAYINDHQVQLLPCRGANCISFGGLNAKNVMTHCRAHVSKQRADDGIVLYHENAHRRRGLGSASGDRRIGVDFR